MAWYVVSGIGLILLALIAEFGIRPKPIVPASFVPGFLFLTVGGAVVFAVADRYLPRFGCLLTLIPAIAIFLVQTIGGNSALPLFLFAGIFQLLRAILRAVPFETPGR